MAQVALAIPPITVQRFSSADLAFHGGWVMKRLVERYPHKNERAIANYLMALVNRNDCLFLRTDHAVALAEVVTLNILEEKPIVYERFVWCQDRQNYLWLEEAAAFYGEFRGWARSMGLERIVVNQSSDVPKETIKEYFKKIFVEETTFVRV